MFCTYVMPPYYFIEARGACVRASIYERRSFVYRFQTVLVTSRNTLDLVNSQFIKTKHLDYPVKNILTRNLSVHSLSRKVAFWGFTSPCRNMDAPRDMMTARSA